MTAEGQGVRRKGWLMGRKGRGKGGGNETGDVGFGGEGEVEGKGGRCVVM